MNDVGNDPRAAGVRDPAAVGTVTVIGLGPMGAALARTLLGQGCEVVVWNRSPDRAAPLVAAGARLAVSAAEAVAASRLVLLCVRDHAVAQSILDMPGVALALAGRDLVQMTTIAAEQVVAERDCVQSQGARFLMGCINAYPEAVGRADAFYLYAGDEAAFTAQRATLERLGGKSYWLGADPLAVPAAYCSYGAFALGSIMLYLEGVALARHSGLPLATFRDLACSSTQLVLDRIRDSTRRIKAQQFAGDSASIDTTLAAMREFLGAFRQAGIPARISQVCTDELARLSAEGAGDRDMAVLAESLRQRQRRSRDDRPPASIDGI